MEEKQPIKFDKIQARIQKLSYGLDTDHVNLIQLAMKVIEGIYDGVTTSELDNLAAEIAATMASKHPDYSLLASRIAISNLHKNTQKSFSSTMSALYHFVHPKNTKEITFNCR